MSLSGHEAPVLKTFPFRTAINVAKAVVGFAAVLLAAIALLYVSHRGFRRTVQFWTSVSPLIAEYKLLEWKCRFLDCSEADRTSQALEFHKKTAPKIVGVVLRLGGIYIKIGQLLSTVGSGVLDDAYVSALKSLQAGVPPRPLSQISRIIERSVGRRMEDLFTSFEEMPLGAASIAQAHRAILKDGTRVIVKIQYPDVAELYGEFICCGTHLSLRRQLITDVILSTC
jgi:predicted unusual protein kinase regulating ubiquinone biosynthesis (AarF/ABC1/UbiB family)